MNAVTRLLCLLTLALTLFGSAAPALAQAEAPAPAVIAATPVAGTAVVKRDEVATDFPKGLTFTFEATAKQPITRVDLLYRATVEKTLSLSQPHVKPATDVSLTQTVDLETAGVPPGIDLLYHWRIYEADGGVTETPEKPVSWTDTRFDWTTLKGQDVTVFAYNNDPSFNQAILDRAEQTIATLNDRFGAKPNRPIRIWVYNSGNDFSGALAPNSEPWIAGAAFPWYGLILAILPDGNMSEVARIVPHEMSHQALFAATDNPFGGTPAWLDEGFAVYNQVGGKTQYPAIVKAALAHNALPSVRALNGQFPYDTQQALIAYAESLSIVTFILDRWGQDGVAKLIDAFHQGTTPDAATKQALGVDLDQLNTQWRAWVAQQPASGGGLTAPFGDGEFPVGGAPPGMLAMGVAALLAIFAGVVAARRNRRGSFEPAGSDAPSEQAPHGRVVDSPSVSHSA
ncbi:MAG TPA: peptidase MA family metallohydrolase [Thermomicrobiales bacterium]|nr:peptidase MA family metallohydrolase [Thermomicrobiales bacterium]